MARNQQGCAVRQQSPDQLQWNYRITQSSSTAAEARDATASDISIMKITLNAAIVENKYTEKKEGHVL